MDFKNPDDIKTFVKDRASDAQQYRGALAQVTATSECYFEGVQYINRVFGANYNNTTSGRVYTNIHPDSDHMRVTSNFVTEFAIKAAGATFPTLLDASARPPTRDSGIEQSNNAQVFEDAVNAATNQCGLLAAARSANMRRVISGDYGIMLSMTINPRGLSVGGNDMVLSDHKITAQDFHPLRLVLDPAITARDIRSHYEVIYQDVWTAQKIREIYPSLKFRDEDLKTFAELTPFEQEVNRLSDGQLFSQYGRLANTKGGRVYQVHVKGANRWDRMYCCVEFPTGKGELQCVNMDNPVSPFGGDGLPFILLHGHQRSGSMWSISDCMMMKDPQDIHNLLKTWEMRHGQKMSGFQWLVDKRWFPANVTDEDMRMRLHNGVGGIIVGGPKSSDRTIQQPTLVQVPPPSPCLREAQADERERARAATFRTPGDSGLQKTHIANATVELNRQDSGQVLGIRVVEDKRAYEQLLGVLLGTTILNAQQGCPTTLAMLSRDGFTEDDIAVILNADPFDPPVHLELSESAIRYRSSEEKRDAVTSAAQVQLLSPSEFRDAMADLDFPLTDMDANMRTAILRKVTRCIQGEPWRAMPLGRFNRQCIDKLQEAMLDRRVEADPQAQLRISNAIHDQMQMVAVEQELMTPTPPMDPNQVQPPATQDVVGDEAEQAHPTTIGGMMDIVMNGSGASTGQPVLA